MELDRRPPMRRCDCYMACADGIEFQKIVESDDVAIYRYVPHSQEAIQITDGGGEIYVLQNTGSAKVTSQDLVAVFEQNVVSCPRCLKIIEKAENFLKKLSLVDREDVLGVCDHCVRRQRPLSSSCKCQDVVDKFLSEDREQRKQQVKAWLKRVQDQLNKSTQNTRRINKLKGRTRSELSLNTAIYKYYKSEYEQHIDSRPDTQLRGGPGLKRQLPHSARHITADYTEFEKGRPESQIRGSARLKRHLPHSATDITSDYTDFLGGRPESQLRGSPRLKSQLPQSNRYATSDYREFEEGRPEYQLRGSPRLKSQLPQSNRYATSDYREFEEGRPEYQLRGSPRLKSHLPHSARAVTSDYTEFEEGRLENRLRGSPRLKSHLPHSTRAISSIDSLHDAENFFKPKEFHNLFAPLRYPKQSDETGIPFMSTEERKYEIKEGGATRDNVQFRHVEPLDGTLHNITKARHLPEKTFQESVFIDPQEYIKRVISPDAADEAKKIPKLIAKDSDSEIPTKEQHRTKRDFFKFPEDKQLSEKVAIGRKIEPFDVDSFLVAPKEHKVEKKPKRTGVLKSHEYEKIKSETPSTLLLDISAPGRDKIKSSSSPLLQKKHSKESFLKETDEKEISRVFSFSFPKEKVIVKKLGKRQVSSSELIKNTQDMLKAKAEEEKRKKQEELDRKREEEERKRREREKLKEQALAAKLAKAEEEKRRKEAEEAILREAEKEKHKEAEEEIQGLEDETKKSLKEAKKETLHEKSVKPKTSSFSSPSSKKKQGSEKEKSDKGESGAGQKKDKQERPPKSKEDKAVDQEILKKTRPDKKDNHDNDTPSLPKSKKSDSENEGTKPKPVKEKKDDTEDKHTKPDKEQKDEKEPSKKIEPKSKNDKNDKLEDNTLKALLASQQKEKQEQEKMLREQQKAEELARKKAEEAAKPGKSADNKAKEEAANKLKKLKESPETPEPPPPPKKEEIPNTKELALKEVKMKRPSTDDLMLRLVKLKKEENREKKVDLSNMNPIILNEHGKRHKKTKHGDCLICTDSELALDFDELVEEKKISVDVVVKDVIIGDKIFKIKGPFKMPQGEPFLEHKEIQEAHAQGTKPASPPTRVIKKNEEVDPEATKGVIRYALSDRTFIDKGWTMLPTEKVVRKMNVYRMRPAHPEFDWFEHNKYKRVLEYDCGAKLAEIDDNGRGRWYYRSGKLALDYYDAEELNAQQRFVVYSSGEQDDRGRTRPRTILASFDYLGNGVVFDHTGKIRLKYNQTEGVVLDRNIGPVSHWKWHTLNDPPVLQQVMIDTQMAFKDPRIVKLGEKNQEKVKPDNEEMLAIEFDNFIKEKSRKLTQTFKPFQIKMKALKINEYFSLRVLDQATVYLLFRDGTTNLKINMGMILDHKEIVDTDTAEVGEVSNSLERMPARTDSIAAMQQAVAQAQRQERSRVRHERRLRPTQACASVDELRSGVSRPLRTQLMVASATGIQCDPQCRFKKPAPCVSASNLYYDALL